MLRAIKKQIFVLWENWSLSYFVTMIMCLFGTALVLVIARFNRDLDTYVELGTIIGSATWLLFVGITLLSEVGANFNMEISMGFTRKEFFVSFYAAVLIFDLLCVPLIFVFNCVERMVLSGIFRNMEVEWSVYPFLLKWGIPISVAVIFVMGFWGALMLRFGKKAGVILWCLWMFGAVFVPRVLDTAEAAPTSLFGKIGVCLANVLHRVPGNGWIFLIVLLSVLSLAGSYLILRKQQVTN